VDYRQMQAQQARAELYELEAAAMKKQQELDQKREQLAMYMSAFEQQTPAAAAPAPTFNSDGWSFGRVVGTTVLIVLAMAVGGVWNEVGHRGARAVRQADMQGSWGHSAPASVWSDE